MVSVSAFASRRVCGVSSLSAIFAAAIASAALGFESTPSGTRGIFARLDADRPNSGPSQGWGAQQYYPLAPERRRHRARKHTSPQEAKSPVVSRPERPLFAVISIGDQRISIYNHDGLVERSQISTGVPGHPTPKGLFTIIGRERFHRSNLYSGAPMPFMQRITWSGVAMHLGVVPGHPASHGCIRLPAGFAAKLWGMTKIGERVVISPHDVAPSEFTHPLLPTPMMRIQGDADKTASATNVQEASVVPIQAPLINPRQFADQLKAKTAAEAAAAIKAVKDASLAVAEKRQESARATSEFRAAEKALALAQTKADAAESAFQKAAAAASAKREEFEKAAAEGADANGAARPDTDRLAKARDDAEAARQAAAATKASADAALAEATTRLHTATSVSDSKAADLEEAIRHSSDATAAAQAAMKAEKEAILRQSPISVLFSKKDKRVYVRQGLTPIFDAPANVRDPDVPLGSHLYIATAPDTDGASLKWSVVSLPSRGGDDHGERARKSRYLDERAGAASRSHGIASSPTEALERIEIAPEIRDRIAERLWAGGSMIISDQPPSSETGAVGTDLTVKMR